MPKPKKFKVPTRRVNGVDAPPATGGRKAVVCRPPDECFGEFTISSWQSTVNQLAIPKNAVSLVSYVDIPGDNIQRGMNSFLAKAAWRDQLDTDFKRSLAMQEHPGVFKNPQVRIYAEVGSASDLNAKLGRYKKPIDNLQVARVDKLGRQTGLLGLIDTDKHLDIRHEHIVEVVSRKKNPDGTVNRKIIMWIWEAQ
jgi:hypothetical protein